MICGNVSSKPSEPDASHRAHSARNTLLTAFAEMKPPSWVARSGDGMSATS